MMANIYLIFFCNNANAAIDKNIWKKYKFNEDLTGLEDMELAKRFNQDKGCIKYVSESCVFHIHNESSKQTKEDMKGGNCFAKNNARDTGNFS